MTPALILLAAFTAVTPSPFAPDMTLSYDSAIYGEGVLNGFPYWALSETDIPSVMATHMVADADSVGDQTVIGDGACHACLVTPASAVTDWITVYQMRIGVQVEDFLDWQWPDPEWAMLEALNHLRDSFATIHAVFLRDYGVDLKIQHIHFVETPLLHFEGIRSSFTIDRWQSLAMTQPVKVILRLPSYTGGGGRADLSGPCDIGGAYAFRPIWAWYAFSFPTHNDESNSRNPMLQAILQELSHQLIGLAHSQCYRYADGTPVEACYDAFLGPGSSCWTDPTICPPYDELSFQGYCQNCYTPYQVPAQRLPWPALRLGPGLKADARLNVLSYATACNLPIVGTLPDGGADTDGDGFPDTRADNCSTVANPEQLDADHNGIGDACQGCAIGPAHGAAWPLLVALPLMWRSGRTCGSARRLHRSYVRPCPAVSPPRWRRESDG